MRQAGPDTLPLVHALRQLFLPQVVVGGRAQAPRQRELGPGIFCEQQIGRSFTRSLPEANRRVQPMAIPEDSRPKEIRTGPHIPSRTGGQLPSKLTKRLYSIQEAADYLALSTWTVRELIWQGKLPHVRLGRRILLDLQDLDALIAHHKLRQP
jgi:excisionase family DNA binding protein